MTNKEKYKAFSEKYEDQLIFSMKYSWWEQVVDSSWKVAIYESGGETLGVWPYFIRKKGPWTLIAQAYLSPYAYPFLVYPEGQKHSSRISFENKAYQELIEQLGNPSEVSLSFPPIFKNGLAFLWNNFEIHTRYTYLLQLKQTEDELWSGLRENIRRQIRKAEKSLSISEAWDSKILNQLVKETFEAQKQALPWPDEDLPNRLVNYLESSGNGKLYFCADQDGNQHAALAVVYDSDCAYYILGGSAQKFKNSGAMSLLLWNAIKEAKAKGFKKFNFEGSIIPAIEKYLRGFGGELTSYLKVSKSQSKSLELVKKLKK